MKAKRRHSSRLVWPRALHQRFERAVAKLGLDEATPLSIVTLMQQDGHAAPLCTRKHIKSHLQKYRTHALGGAAAGRERARGGWRGADTARGGNR
eukprot:6757814-Prymnesium_polylepis.1